MAYKMPLGYERPQMNWGDDTIKMVHASLLKKGSSPKPKILVKTNCRKSTKCIVLHKVLALVSWKK